MAKKKEKPELFDIHGSAELLKGSIKRLKESKATDKNKKLILAFINSCVTSGNRGTHRRNKYLFHLKVIAERIGKDLDKAQKKDIEAFVTWLEKSDYGDNTRRDFRGCLKVFFKWLEAERLKISVRELEQQRKEPATVAWFSTGGKKNGITLPQQILNEDDIILLLNNTTCSRDRAFISVLYESAGRIGEIGSLKIGSIAFDEFGCKISVSGKTGDRVIRCITCTKFLQTWLNEHQLNGDLNAPLWIGKQTKKPIEYAGLAKIIKQAARRAGLQKPINPHAFRHARLTALAKVLKEAQLTLFAGWTSSDQCKTYVHLSQRDVDDAILGAYGLKEKPSEEKSKLLPRVCIYCTEPNEPTALFCSKCLKPLTLQAAQQYETEFQEKWLRLREMETRLALVEQMLKAKK
ncbi:MAG: tyrosine-type recombinase/integrase [Candidatus Diapherotrites archaeon]